MVTTAIAQPTTTAVMIPWEAPIEFAVLIRWPIVTSFATPTAAQEPDQPTSLSPPLGLLSLTFRARCHQAHISDTTSTGSRGHPNLTKRTLSGTVRIQEATTFNERISITLRCHSRP